MAFYFLLRSSEYTKPGWVKRYGKMGRATQIVQFRICDVGCWKNNKVLLRRLPLNVLSEADSATMKI